MPMGVKFSERKQTQVGSRGFYIGVSVRVAIETPSGARVLNCNVVMRAAHGVLLSHARPSIRDTLRSDR